MANQPKSYRKFLAGSVTAAIVASAVSPAFAAEVGSNFSDVPASNSHSEDIAKAVSYELMKGYPNNTFQPGKALTRSDVVKTIARYLEKANGEVDTTNVTPFADVTADYTDGELYKASLVVKKYNVFAGDTKGNLNPADKISRQAMAKVLVNAFGLDKLDADASVVKDNDLADEWARTYINTLSGLGITTETMFRPTENTDRGQFASFLVRSYEKVMAPVEVTPEVTGVSAINNKQLVVKFNQAVDGTSAADETNYVVKDNGVLETLSATSAEVSEDGMSVTLTLNNAIGDKLTNSTKAEVTVKKELVFANGATLGTDYVNKEVSVFDGVIPTVTSAKAVGLKTLELTFSEPVWDGTDAFIANSNITVKSGSYTYYVNSVSADGKTVTVDLGTNLIEGDVTVTVNAAGAGVVGAIQDFAGIAAFKGETTFTYKKDTSAPTVAVKEISPTSVTLKFDRPVYGEDVMLYHTVKGVANYGVEVDKIGAGNASDEWTFNFGDSKKLPAGPVKLYLVNSTVAANQITDLFGNKLADTTLNAEIILDTTAPTVVGTKLNTNASYDLTFSEKLDATEAGKTANYSLKSVKDGKDVPFSVSYNDTDKKVTVTPTTPFTDNTDYALTVNAAKDVAGNALASSYTKTFTVGDNTNPSVNNVYSVNADGKIYVEFSEAINDADLLNKDNYLYDADGGTTWVALGADDKVTKISDKKVVIDLDGVVLNSASLKIGTLKDLAGKKLGGDSNFETVLNTINEEQVTVQSAELIAKNKVKLTFNNQLANFDNTEFSFLNTNTHAAFTNNIQIQSVESMSVNSDGVTEVVVVLDRDLSYDAKFAEAGTPQTVEVKTVTTPVNTKSVEGTVLLGAQTDAVDDTLAPVVDKVVYVSPTEIEVHFSEALDATTLAAAGKNGFSIAGGTLTSALLDGSDDSVVTLTGTNFTANSDVSFSGNNITDTATVGNALAAFSKTDALTNGAITVVASGTPDNKFTVTTNFTTDAIVAGDVDMDTATTGVQSTVTINGITYTVTDAAGVVTITATGTAAAASNATSATVKVNLDGTMKNVTFAIPAYALGGAAVQPVINNQ